MHLFSSRKVKQRLLKKAQGSPSEARKFYKRAIKDYGNSVPSQVLLQAAKINKDLDNQSGMEIYLFAAEKLFRSVDDLGLEELATMALIKYELRKYKEADPLFDKFFSKLGLKFSPLEDEEMVAVPFLNDVMLAETLMYAAAVKIALLQWEQAELLLQRAREVTAPPYRGELLFNLAEIKFLLFHFAEANHYFFKSHNSRQLKNFTGHAKNADLFCDFVLANNLVEDLRLADAAHLKEHLDRPAEANELYDRAIAAGDHSPETVERALNLKNRLGRHNEIEALFDQIKSELAWTEDLLYPVAFAKFILKKPQEAHDLLKDLSFSMQEPHMLRLMADINMQLGNFVLADDLYNRLDLLSITPGHYLTLLNAAEAKLQTIQPIDALKLYLRLVTDLSEGIHENLSECAELIKTEQFLDSLSPENYISPSWLTCAAFVKWLRKKPAEAELFCDRATVFESEQNSLLLYVSAFVKYELGHHQEALLIFENLIPYFDGRCVGLISFHMGDIYSKQQKMHEAHQSFTQARMFWRKPQYKILDEFYTQALSKLTLKDTYFQEILETAFKVKLISNKFEDARILHDELVRVGGGLSPELAKEYSFREAKHALEKSFKASPEGNPELLEAANNTFNRSQEQWRIYTRILSS